jgi:hypothetical protein
MGLGEKVLERQTQDMLALSYIFGIGSNWKKLDYVWAQLI